MQKIYEQRRLKAYRCLREEGIKKALVGDSLTMYHLTGVMLHPYDRFLGLVLNAEQERCDAIIPTVNSHCMKDTSINECLYNDNDGPLTVLHDKLAGASKIGVEMGYYSMVIGNLLHELNVPIIDVTKTFKQVRQIKDQHEINLICEAAKCANIALDHLKTLMREGVSEKELALDLYCTMATTPGVITESTCIQTLTGASSDSPHGWPGDRTVKCGDTITVDFCTCYQYYWADMSRNFFVGKPSDKLYEVYNIVLEANMAAIQEVEPGKPAKYVDQAARNVIKKYGYGELFLHRTGHGIGLDIHEDPYMDEVNELIMQEGMVFTIEPGIYLPGIGGIRIEDDILVTGSGHSVLTTYPKNIQDMIL